VGLPGERFGVGVEPEVDVGTELLGEGVTLDEGGVGVGVELGDAVGVGLGGLLMAYSAASIIIPFVLSMSDESTLPLSSMPSEYPFVGLGS